MVEIKIEIESLLLCIGIFYLFYSILYSIGIFYDDCRIYKKNMINGRNLKWQLMSVHNLCLRKDLGNIFVLLPDFDMKSLITKVITFHS